MLTAVVGTNWGDEGKGRMVDLLSEKYDIVIRYQGGNNAGHTVVNEKGKFILNLLPSGILRDETVNVMGPGMVIDLEHLFNEIKMLRDKGIELTPKHLVISDRATICMPYHKMRDILEEDRLADEKFGSTRRGIAPVYADKYMKKTLRMGDLLHAEHLTRSAWRIGRMGEPDCCRRLCARTDFTGRHVSVARNLRISVQGLYQGYHSLPRRCGTGRQNLMFEAQLGALRDIDFGIYPYTSSSSTIAAYAPIGAGIPFCKEDCVVRHYESLFELRRRRAVYL